VFVGTPAPLGGTQPKAKRKSSTQPLVAGRKVSWRRSVDCGNGSPPVLPRLPGVGQSFSTKDESLRRLGISQRGGRSGERAETPPNMGEKIVEYSPGCRTALRNRDCCSSNGGRGMPAPPLSRCHFTVTTDRSRAPAAATRDIVPLGYRSEIAYLSTAHMSTSRRIWVVPSSKTVLTSNRHPASSSILTKAELAGAR
jgi:hypothetical protein